MSRLSIRWKLTLWYSVSIAFMLCAFSVVLYVLMQRQALRRIDVGLAEEVEEIGLEIKLAKSTEALRTAANTRFSQHLLYEFLILDGQRHIVFASPGIGDREAELFSHGSFATNDFTQDVEGIGEHRIATGRIASSFGELDVYVLSSLQPLQADLSTLRWVMLALLPAVSLVSLGIGHALTGRALAPVQQLVDVASGIDISCLDRRVKVTNPHDEVGKLSIALNSLIERLQKAIDEIRRFTADASHEIRTPITSLRMAAEGALRAVRSPSEYVRVLKIIVDEASRLTRLTEQLLQLSRSDAGIVRRNSDAVQLDALLHDVVDHLRPTAESRGVKLRCETHLACDVVGDDIHLSQALFNVIDNAVKYTSSGGIVEVSLHFEDGQATIDVTDTGAGIAADDLPRVFDRFFRVDESRQLEADGTGLGLSIARTAIVEHRGSIDVRSTLGQGTSVTIRLPASKSTNDSLALGAKPADREVNTERTKTTA